MSLGWANNQLMEELTYSEEAVAAARKHTPSSRRYLHYVFQKAPQITSPAGWDALLPQNLTAEVLTAALPNPLRQS